MSKTLKCNANSKRSILLQIKRSAFSEIVNDEKLGNEVTQEGKCGVALAKKNANSKFQWLLVQLDEKICKAEIILIHKLI